MTITRGKWQKDLSWDHWQHHAFNKFSVTFDCGSFTIKVVTESIRPKDRCWWVQQQTTRQLALLETRQLRFKSLKDVRNFLFLEML